MWDDRGWKGILSVKKLLYVLEWERTRVCPDLGFLEQVFLGLLKKTNFIFQFLSIKRYLIRIGFGKFSIQQNEKESNGFI